MNNLNSEHCNDPESFTSITEQDSAKSQHVLSISKTQTISIVILLMILYTALVSASTTQNSHNYDSRNLSFMRLSLEEGLSQGSANAIAQDNQGYIWFGTQEGLNRYDGYTIKVFEHDHKNPTSLSNDWVWSLLVDTDGVLWAGTEAGGLNRYNPDQGTFTHYKHNPDDENSLSHDRVRVIYQDWQGTYWIGTDGGGLNRFDPKTSTFVRYQHNRQDPHSLPNDSILSIMEDRSGNLWIGTRGGLAKINRRTGKFVSFKHDPSNDNSLSDNQVRSLYEDQSGQIWIGTYEGGLNKFDPVTGSFKHYQHHAEDPHSINSNRVRNIFQDNEGTLWIATDGGLNQWLPESHNFSSFMHDPADPSSISDNRITTLFQDRGGVLWIGTYNGINKWNYVSDAFSYYQKYGSHLKLSSNIITSVAESNQNQIWVSTYGGGLNHLNRLTGESIHYRHDDKDPQSLSDDRVMTSYIDSNNTVWVGTRYGGLNRLDYNSESFSHYINDPNDPNSLTANSISSILVEEDGTLWVGTYGGGLNKGHVDSTQFTSYQHDPDKKNSISSNRILRIFRDSTGILWLGTEDAGLNQFDEKNQTFTHYQHNPEDPSSLSNNTTWDITETSDGTFWIASGGGGLIRWLAEDRESGRGNFTSYRKSEGLYSDTIQGILEDNAGYLWLSSNRGLQRFNPENGKVRLYDQSTGLKGNEFNTLARFKNQDGRLYFGGSSGVVGFYPNKIRINQHQPDIVLSSHTRFEPLNLAHSDIPQDSQWISDHSNDTQQKLGYKEDLITFEFKGLDFTAPEKNLYRYKLEGFDADWSPAATFKRTTYTNLPAGDYTFRVMASNNDGIWNKHEKSIQLQVIPPPWKTGWAYALYVMLVICIIRVFLKAQAQKLKREIEQRIYLEEQVEERTHEIADRNNQLQELNKQLKGASVTDALTGLNNRRYMDEFIEAEIALANRKAKGLNETGEKTAVQDIDSALSFMMIDLDGFKAINDTYGHHAGDQALIQVRDILQSCCRESDTIIRWGGDEFLIVSRNTRPQAVETLAERIRKRLAEHLYQLGGGHIGRLSGSIGFAMYPFSLQQPDLVPWEQVVAIADRGTFVAKENGRNAWVGLYGTQSTSQNDLARIKDELGEVINENSLQINTSIMGDIYLGDQTATPRAA